MTTRTPARDFDCCAAGAQVPVAAVAEYLGAVVAVLRELPADPVEARGQLSMIRHTAQALRDHMSELELAALACYLRQHTPADLASCGHPRNADGECNCPSWPERAEFALLPCGCPVEFVKDCGHQEGCERAEGQRTPRTVAEMCCATSGGYGACTLPKGHAGQPEHRDAFGYQFRAEVTA